MSQVQANWFVAAQCLLSAWDFLWKACLDRLPTLVAFVDKRFGETYC